MYSGAVHTNTVKYQPKPVNMYNTFHYTLLMHTNTDHFFLRLAAALLLRLFGKNPRSHHNFNLRPLTKRQKLSLPAGGKSGTGCPRPKMGEILKLGIFVDKIEQN